MITATALGDVRALTAPAPRVAARARANVVRAVRCARPRPRRARAFTPLAGRGGLIAWALRKVLSAGYVGCWRTAAAALTVTGSRGTVELPGTPVPPGYPVQRLPFGRALAERAAVESVREFLYFDRFAFTDVWRPVCPRLRQPHRPRALLHLCVQEARR